MAKDVLTNWFGDDIVKSLVASALLAATGFLGHMFLTGHDQQATLDTHTKQISDLESAVKTTSDSVNQLTVTSARIEGKIDTINTKIDDDRRQSKVDAKNH